MILQLDNPKLLSDAVSIVSEVVSEVKIKLLDEGFSITAVDPANVAMIVFRIPKESFSKYEAGNEVWGVNLEDLKKVLKRAVTASSITLEQEDNQLKITLFDSAKRSFILSLVEVGSEEKPEPSLTFSGEVEMDSKDFSQSIEDCSIIADSCLFQIENGNFILEGSGNVNSARSEFSGEAINCSGLARSKYSLEYLMKFTKARAIADRVTIRLSDNYPLRLDFAGTKMGIGFILAPRVEND